VKAYVDVPKAACTIANAHTQVRAHGYTFMWVEERERKRACARKNESVRKIENKVTFSI